MATATINDSKSNSTASSALGLLPASVVGAIVLLVGLGAIGYVVPLLWDKNVSPLLRPLGGFIDAFCRLLALVAAIGGAVYLASKLIPANPPRGLRGGIFLVAVTIIAFFVVVRWVGLSVESMSIGTVVTGVVAAALAYGAYKFLSGTRGRDWMIGLEEMGWFHTHSFKKTQGIRLRRWTMIGILLLGGTGIYSLVTQTNLPADWTVILPFTSYEKDGQTLYKVLPLLGDFRYTCPILLTVATMWFAWRAVNVPTFADFLIATEAEMNKVSWTTWKKLIQDTIVVLVTTALLTAFLLFIDIFWGWLLSSIGVLPEKAPLKGDPQGQSIPY